MLPSENNNNNNFRPVPAPRTSTLKRNTEQSNSTPQFTLVSPQNTITKNHSTSDLIDTVHTLTTPDNKSNTSNPSLNTTSSSSSLENVKFDGSLQGSIAGGDSGLGPVPQPRMRNNIERKNAFYNGQRPQSFVRVSPVPQASEAKDITKARTEFMQTKTIPKISSSMTNLDIFDPLMSEQVLTDSTNELEKASPLNEDNLLIDWTGVDFAKRKQQQQTKHGPPPIPPKPSSPTKPTTGFVNNRFHSPSGLPRMGVAPPMMRPFVGGQLSQVSPRGNTPVNYGRPVSMYASSVPPNTSFLHSIRQTYTGPQANLQLHGYNKMPEVHTTGGSQDPFGDVLAQCDSSSTNSPQKSVALNNNNKASPMRVQPPAGNQSGVVNHSNFQSVNQSVNALQETSTTRNRKSQWEKFE